jgi:hypothetical protein
LAGKKPQRKPFGRVSPPKGYPKDRSAYADPENWRYPIHTSWNARAARRYFDEESNRAKYMDEEREYIDQRIDEALKRFEHTGPRSTGRPVPRPPEQKNIKDLSLKDLLKLFLGAARLERAEDMEDSLVSITSIDPEKIEGKVKDYVIQIDSRKCTILHDCQDWQKNMDSKAMCKHLGKLLLSIDSKRATDLLQDILKNKDRWTFTVP